MIMSDDKAVKRIELALNKKTIEEKNKGKKKLTMEELNKIAFSQGLLRHGNGWKKI